ncbi:MAG: hypothetical protein KAG37_05900 [Flavobacteriales bacterium]|nr:hypothetical protein [Flavobacteriales bacterium]
MNRKNVFSIAVLTIMLTLSTNLFSQSSGDKLMKENHEQFDVVTHKMDIIPGLWRPMFESEQVAWISPPWESSEYIWFDFPEAIWEEGKLLYLGHVDKKFPTKFPKEKSAPWTKIENGIAYEQVLPNGVSFGGKITKTEDNIASLELRISNGSDKEMKDVFLLTCVYLDGIKEFNEKTNDNKFVHVGEKGWMPFPGAQNMKTIKDGYGVGWISEAKKVSDLPVVVTKSKDGKRLIAMTWFEDTFTFIGNENHPCVHADPGYDNLKPGESQTIHGELIFFEGSMADFETMFRERMKKQ